MVFDTFSKPRHTGAKIPILSYNKTENALQILDRYLYSFTRLFCFNTIPLTANSHLFTNIFDKITFFKNLSI